MAYSRIVTIIIIVILSLSKAADNNNYEGYKVYEVIPQTLQQSEFLHNYADDQRLDFWQESRTIGQPSHIMVAPADQLNFEKELLINGFAYDVVVPNVESIIQQERIERTLTRSSFGIGSVTFSSYMYYEEHMAYLRRLAQDYPNLVTVERIGQSYEGRDILILRISSGPSLTSIPKPVIFIDAGIHCREWIAPPVALYIIHQLVENSNNAAFYANVDWAIVPNLNPDGYAYTQTTASNRLWRKNRRLTEGASCYGTDLNRNFGYQWMFAGASNNSCTEIFAGPEEFSEPEARAIRDWLIPNKENVRLYLTFHSYGELIIYPWGYIAEYPDDAEELQYLGDLAARAIESASTMGSVYYVNNSAIALYATAGASDDWVKAVGGVELSYTVELPNGDAPYWFMLPAKQILPVVEETWAGVQVYHDYIEEKFWTNLAQTPSARDFLIKIYNY